ncbi:hypothetical protein P7K49_006824 [Saguinus oedipus]|uniref:Cytochrome b5 heme-binding domain-containing protein n=1 Tax=Saguinus oedipus TaxID=9490 RepID=A0ABQ9W5Z4_SAGOE|nr:hypothetical protein P7K49_006824 [Saguinus oedipus]
MPEKPGAGSALSLLSRKTPARRQNFSPFPGLRAHAAGFPTRASRQRAQGKSLQTRTQAWEGKRFQGARAETGDWAGRTSRRGYREESSRTRCGLAPPMSVRARRSVGRERGLRPKGGGGRDPRQHYPFNTQSGSGLTPPPSPHVIGWEAPRWAGPAVGRWRAVMAAGDGDLKLGTLGSGSESSSDGSSESPGGAGAAAEGGGWAAAALALLTGGGEMLLNVALVALVLLGAYRLWVRWGRRGLGAGAGAGEESPAASLPRMKKRDFSLEQLRQYDGSRNPRILLAVNGKVFDVTKGSKFYGPGEELEGEGKDPLQLKHDPLRTGRPLGTGLVCPAFSSPEPPRLGRRIWDGPARPAPTHTRLPRGHVKSQPSSL